MKYFILIFILCFSVSTFASGGSSSSATGVTDVPDRNTTKDWTVMVYVCGDNDLEPFAIKDINEMEVVGSTKKINVVTEFDRWDGYVWQRVGGRLQRVRSNKKNDTSNGDWTGARRYFILKDKDGKNDKIISKQIGQEEEKDMGDPDNLKDFLKWGITNFPAKKYIAIVWNHGAGIYGVAFDDNGKGHSTHISSNELGSAMQNALKEAVQDGKLKIDITGFDACLMSMYSIAYNMQKAGKVMIGSEETEPGDGWPYDKFLTYLANNTDKSEDKIAKNIVEEYINSYKGFLGFLGGKTSTLSALSLSPTTKLTKITQKLDKLSNSLMKNDNKKNDRMLKLHSLFQNVQKFEMDGFIDLIDLCEKIKDNFNSLDSDVAKNAEDVIKEIRNQKLILKNKTYTSKVSNANGIAIYFPKYSRMVDSSGNRYYYPPASVFYQTEFAKNSKWDELIKFYFATLKLLPDNVVGVERI